jgi:hypothetical protein
MDKDPLLRRTARPEDNAAGACLDAETLAAWIDGTVPDAERTTIERHTADCARCLALLSAIATTEPPPVVETRRGWTAWRWVVPLATASIAITAWVVVRDAAVPQPSEAPATAQVDTVKPSPETPAAARPAQEAPREVAKGAEEAAGLKSVPVVPEQREQRRADDPTISGALDRVQVTANDARRERKDVAGVAESVALPAPVPPAPTAPPPPSTTPAARFSAAPPLVISQTDPNVRWRLSGVSVERSLDAGATWRAQTIPTTTLLAAGSSPSRDVCWIVGASGTVLVTTDGETWRRVDFPETRTNLRGVVATTAAQVAVTTAEGKTYVTADGGATWRLQEGPSAPF